MDENRSWQVVITNQLRDDQDKNRIIAQLAALFKIEPARAAQLISKPRTVVKDQLDESTAKKYLSAINKTGAPCEIINTAGDEALPDIMEPVVPESAAATEGLIQRPKANESTPRDLEMAMVEKERKDEAETREKLAAFQNLDQSLYCPECGTIRSSSNAVCLQCGFDPAQKTDRQSRLPRMVGIAAALLLVLAAAGYFALPFYHQFAKRYAIHEGMQLALDTRNQITEFILRTNFWPNQNLDANLPKKISNDVIESIQITGNGAFTVTLHEHVLGQPGLTLIFKPRQLKGKLVWNCTEGTLGNAYRPDICQTQLE